MRLQGMALSVESLHGAMQRVRAEVLQPYATIRTQTAQMGNLHATTDMLRHVLHRLKLIAKLKVTPCPCMPLHGPVTAMGLRRGRPKWPFMHAHASHQRTQHSSNVSSISRVLSVALRKGSVWHRHRRAHALNASSRYEFECMCLLQALNLDVEDRNAIPDAAKAARLLTDVAAVSQEMDFSGLSVVKADTEYLEAVSQKAGHEFVPT